MADDWYRGTGTTGGANKTYGDSKAERSMQGAFRQSQGQDDWTTRRKIITGITLGGAEFWDPLNLRGVDSSYKTDPNAYVLGGDNQSLYGGMGLARENRQISPEMQRLLMARATGQTDSPAELQLKAGLQQQQNQAMSMAASNPNVNPALAQRMAANAMAQQGAQYNQQAAILRAQEQAAATNQAANYTLQQQQLNDQLVERFMQMGLDADQAQLQANIEQEKIKSGAYNQGQDRVMQEKGATMQMVGSAMGAMAASDKRLKKDVKKDDSAVGSMLKALSSYRFKYKDEKHGQGEHLGIMAQDLEKSELGKTLVVDTPDGKMVDLKRATMAALASVAHLNKRLDAIAA